MILFLKQTNYKMKYKIYLLIILILLFYTSSIKSQNNIPVIKVNRVKISGKIISQSGKNQLPTTVHFFAPLPVSGKVLDSKIKTDSYGNFTIDVDLEVFPSNCGLSTDINPNSGINFIINQQKSNIEIYYDSINSIKKMQLTHLISSMN